MKESFQYQLAGEVCGEWTSGSDTLFETSPGELFFLAQWTKEEESFAWFGIYHESLKDVEVRARELFECSGRWLADPNQWSVLSELSNASPGWGLVYGNDEFVRLWRDPIGRLPIFWMRKGQRVEWATRPSALKSFEPNIRRSRVEKFLARTGDSERDDFWQGVSRVRAGECLHIRRGGQPQFVDWWPPQAESCPPEAEITQRVGDLLTEAVQRATNRGANLVSLSGGVDSPLLLSLMVEAGPKPAAISMVDPTTRVFHERQVIEEILEDLAVEGTFVDISGAMDWADARLHHPVYDFGPTAFSEAAYFIPFLHKAETLLGSQQPKILVSGVGADQIFGCRADDLLRDQMTTSSGWLPVAKRRKWKIFAKKVAHLSGLPAAPGRDLGKTRAPWLPGSDSKNRWDLYTDRFYDRDKWSMRRRRQFRSWTWEDTVRLMERYRRTTGFLFDVLYLTLPLVELALSLPPAKLRNINDTKLPLRRLLSTRVSSGCAWGKKRGVFNEIVWRGLGFYLEPSPDELFLEPQLTQLVSITVEGLKKKTDEIRDLYSKVKQPFGHEYWRAVGVELWLHENADELSMEFGAAWDDDELSV